MSEPKTIRVIGSGGDYEDWPNPKYKATSAPETHAVSDPTIVKLKLAIARVREQGGQPKWKCGECNGWTGYFCPNHQAIDAMETALKVIESQNK